MKSTPENLRILSRQIDRLNRLMDRAWNRVAASPPNSRRFLRFDNMYGALAERKMALNAEFTHMNRALSDANRAAIRARGGLDMMSLIENIERDRRAGRMPRRRGR